MSAVRLYAAVVFASRKLTGAAAAMARAPVARAETRGLRRWEGGGTTATAGPNLTKGSTAQFNFVGLHNPKTKSQRVALRGRGAPLSQMILEDDLNEQMKARRR